MTDQIPTIDPTITLTDLVEGLHSQARETVAVPATTAKPTHLPRPRAERRSDRRTTTRSLRKRRPQRVRSRKQLAATALLAVAAVTLAFRPHATPEPAARDDATFASPLKALAATSVEPKTTAPPADRRTATKRPPKRTSKQPDVSPGDTPAHTPSAGRSQGSTASAPQTGSTRPTPKPSRPAPTTAAPSTGQATDATQPTTTSPQPAPVSQPAPTPSTDSCDPVNENC